MQHYRKDKYGRGSASVNGFGFVDLEPGDTFSGLEIKLREKLDVVFVNNELGITASISSKRNANELAKHMATNESEEPHKFAAKNIGILFSSARIGIRHFDKKAIRDDIPKPMMLRVFAPFWFANERMLATITLRAEESGNKLYSIQALEINQDACFERTPRGETAPFQNLASSLSHSISYYVGDVNRTKPEFISISEPFSIELAAYKIAEIVSHRFDGLRQSPLLQGRGRTE